MFYDAFLRDWLCFCSFYCKEYHITPNQKAWYFSDEEECKLKLTQATTLFLSSWKPRSLFKVHWRALCIPLHSALAFSGPKRERLGALTKAENAGDHWTQATQFTCTSGSLHVTTLASQGPFPGHTDLWIVSIPVWAANFLQSHYCNKLRVVHKYTSWRKKKQRWKVQQAITFISMEKKWNYFSLWPNIS